MCDGKPNPLAVRYYTRYEDLGLLTALGRYPSAMEVCLTFFKIQADTQQALFNDLTLAYRLEHWHGGVTPKNEYAIFMDGPGDGCSSFAH